MYVSVHAYQLLVTRQAVLTCNAALRVVRSASTAPPGLGQSAVPDLARRKFQIASGAAHAPAPKTPTVYSQLTGTAASAASGTYRWDRELAEARQRCDVKPRCSRWGLTPRAAEIMTPACDDTFVLIRFRGNWLLFFGEREKERG